jgi:hypothetical protein
VIFSKWSLGDQEIGGKVKLGKCIERMDKDMLEHNITRRLIKCDTLVDM